jgi:hypothetical protein
MGTNTRQRYSSKQGNTKAAIVHGDTLNTFKAYASFKLSRR